MWNPEKYFFDDPEYGLMRSTSHPRFVKTAQLDFYYDCVDDFSPFGNDDGAETLSALMDWYKQRTEDEDIVDWMLDRIDGYGFPFDAETSCMIQDIDSINKVNEVDDNYLLCMDETIIATAFGQYKIEGILDEELKELALIAIRRQRILNNEILQSGVVDFGKLLQIVERVSTRPDSSGGTSHLTKKYLERLEIMEQDLMKFQTLSQD